MCFTWYFDSPILYLSSYIVRNKSAYYSLLQEDRTHENWEEWIIYILTGIEETAEETLRLIKRINVEVETMRAEIKERLPKIYSKELIDLLFYEFYTKTVYIENGLSVARKTNIASNLKLEIVTELENMIIETKENIASIPDKITGIITQKYNLQVPKSYTKNSKINQIYNEINTIKNLLLDFA